jgi:hypothetical protein
MSDISPICVGVPQTAVAAPQLFNLFIAVQLTTPNTITGDFPDDKALLAHDSGPELVSQFIQ